MRASLPTILLAVIILGFYQTSNCYIINAGYVNKLISTKPYLPAFISRSVRRPATLPPLPDMNSENQQTSVRKRGMLSTIGDLLRGEGWDGKLKISRQSLAKLGLNVLLAYGFVSNVSYITCVILAWVAHGRTYKLSPLAPGQWKYYLLIYSGLFAANNILRPLRFSLSLVLSPFFDRMVVGLEKRLHISKSWATALLVFLVNIVGSTSYLVLGLMAATKWANVPLLHKPV